EQRDDREGVDADPLEPEELAGDEPRDLGEEETPARGDGRDEEHEPELVALQRGAHSVAWAAQPEEPREPDEQQQAGQHLPHDPEDREQDDDVMRHRGASNTCSLLGSTKKRDLRRPRSHDDKRVRPTSAITPRPARMPARNAARGGCGQSAITVRTVRPIVLGYVAAASARSRLSTRKSSGAGCASP